MIATIANMKKMRAKYGASLIAFSPETGEECSAAPGDYWDVPDREFLVDADGMPMLLGVVQRTIIEEVEDA